MTTTRNCGTQRADSLRAASTAARLHELWGNLVKKSPLENRLEVGVFPTVEGARPAVQGLLDARFTKDQITVMCSDETKERYFQEFEHQEPAGTYTPTAVITGATIGALLGGRVGRRGLSSHGWLDAFGGGAQLPPGPVASPADSSGP